jgi:hypothetical protein
MTKVALLRGGVTNGQVVGLLGLVKEACLTGLTARIIHRPTRERRRPWKTR